MGARRCHRDPRCWQEALWLTGCFNLIRSTISVPNSSHHGQPISVASSSSPTNGPSCRSIKLGALHLFSFVSRLRAHFFVRTLLAALAIASDRLCMFVYSLIAGTAHNRFELQCSRVIGLSICYRRKQK